MADVVAAASDANSGGRDPSLGGGAPRKEI
jgi:hypothetical protein